MWNMLTEEDACIHFQVYDEPITGQVQEGKKPHYQPSYQTSPSHARLTGFDSQSGATANVRLAPKEQAYVGVVQRDNQAASAGGATAAAFDLVREFTAACRSNEDRCGSLDITFFTTFQSPFDPACSMWTCSLKVKGSS